MNRIKLFCVLPNYSSKFKSHPPSGRILQAPGWTLIARGKVCKQATDSCRDISPSFFSFVYQIVPRVAYAGDEVLENTSAGNLISASVFENLNIKVSLNMGQVELVEWIARPSSNTLNLGPITPFQISVLFCRCHEALYDFGRTFDPGYTRGTRQGYRKKSWTPDVSF